MKTTIVVENGRPMVAHVISPSEAVDGVGRRITHRSDWRGCEVCERPLVLHPKQRRQ